MKKILKKITSIVAVVAVTTSFVINPAIAATRLTPYHLYKWASTNNIQRLHQFKRYINLQDKNKNTALCIAQQAKNQKAYATLLKFGASTNVKCHDDDDPICAIITKEKLKISPAWWIAGAGMVGAYLMFDSDSGGDNTPEKLCDINLYPHLNTCPTGQVPVDECTDSKGIHYSCICDATSYPYDDMCPTGMTDINQCTDEFGTHYNCRCDETQGRYIDKTSCETNQNGGRGYDCSTIEASTGCYIRETLLCINPEKESCDTPSTGVILEDNLSGNHAGEIACHNCDYTCDTTNKYYSDKSVCETNNDNFTCSSAGTSPVDCFIPTACETGYQSTACDTGEGYTSTPINENTVKGETCHQCQYSCASGWTAGTCPEGKVCDTITTPVQCYKNPQCPTTHTYTSETECEEGGYTCSESATGSGCWKRDKSLACTELNADAVTQCTDYTGLTTTPKYIGQAGGDNCYTCEYACDETNYFADNTNYSKCGTGGNEGWTFVLDTYGKGVQCYTCQTQTCG
ncbi:MAG: hypothetical protein IJZ30_04220, partial [Alphaproteobacteria bacterium]|nr:hypothetical protein [Alphaproteobacteria bacterium]